MVACYTSQKVTMPEFPVTSVERLDTPILSSISVHRSIQRDANAATLSYFLGPCCWCQHEEKARFWPLLCIHSRDLTTTSAKLADLENRMAMTCSFLLESVAAAMSNALESSMIGSTLRFGRNRRKTVPWSTMLGRPCCWVGLIAAVRS
jgi:hypothetical protein